MHVHRQRFRRGAVRHDDVVGGQQWLGQAEPAGHRHADRGRLGTGVQDRHAGHAIERDRHQQPVAARFQAFDLDG